MPHLFGLVENAMSSERHSMTLHPAALTLALMLTALPLAAQAARLAPSPAGCGESHNSYGPFDHRTAQASQLFIVENTHFTRGVENLTGGGTGSLGHDIAYTLAVFPNHPRAILSMARLAEKMKSDPPKDADMTVECYFVRGMNFVPDDLVFRMLYVNYLIKRQRLDEARRFLDYVVTQAGDNQLTHYNAGLLYFDMKDYDKALAQAHRAMAMGVPRTDLRDRLVSAGRWKEPASADVPDAAASAASQSSP